MATTKMVLVKNDSLREAYRSYKNTALNTEHADEVQIAIHYWLTRKYKHGKDYVGGIITGSDEIDNYYQILLFPKSECEDLGKTDSEEKD
ncbi:MAG TPA: hypothetical protein VJT71_15100 [Pyrinomonadaceae bacterium]|nr:hypothetical protein [Pyrinomonadaceae bacterium]